MSTRQTVAASLAVLAVLLAFLGVFALPAGGFLGLLALILLLSAAGLVVYALVVSASRPKKPRRIGRLEFVAGNVCGVVLGVACFIHAVQGVSTGKFPRWARTGTDTHIATQPVKFVAKLAVSVGLGTGLLWFFLPPLVRGRTQ